MMNMNSSDENKIKEIKLNVDFSIRIMENLKFGVAGEVWNSAYLLSSLITSKKCERIMKNKTILEIGSGTGICGIFASLSGAKKVYLTDREDNLNILHESFQLNKIEIANKNCEIVIKSLDWNYAPSFKNIEDKIDLIIASDIVYHGLNYNNIVELIKYFSKNKNIKINNNKPQNINQDKLESNTEVILAFTSRLGSSLEFFDLIEANKADWDLRKLNFDFIEFEHEVLEKIIYSELFSLKYLK